MRDVVIDASVAVKWLVEEVGSAEARRLSDRRLHAPDLLSTECANALWRKTLNGELTAEEAQERLAALGRAPIALSPSNELAPMALGIALDLRHPVHDCVYLALAVRRRARLVTVDRRLLEAIRSSSTYADHARMLGEAD